MDNNLLELKISNMQSQLDMMYKMLAEVLDKDSYIIMSVKDIADMLNMNKRSLYAKPWLLPNFGRSEGQMEWTKKEVKSWLDKGADTLREQYLELAKEKTQQRLGSNC